MQRIFTWFKQICFTAKQQLICVANCAVVGVRDGHQLLACTDHKVRNVVLIHLVISVSKTSRAALISTYLGEGNLCSCKHLKKIKINTFPDKVLRSSAALLGSHS